MPCSLLWIAISAFAVVEAAIVPADPSKSVSWPFHTFKTVDFNPPVLNITHHTAPSEGYLFFAPDGPTPYQVGPLIMDMYGELVWNGPEEHANSFGTYVYNGADVLAWWNGTVFSEPLGRGYGTIKIWNNNYEQIAEPTLEGNFLSSDPGSNFPSNIDLHELQITANGSLIVTANNVTQADLTPVGGPSDGWVVSGMVYVIDIATNEVVFRWSSVEHLDAIPFTDSLYTLGTDGQTGANQSLAWGYFHINSVDPYEDGYIVSSRFLCSAIAFDGSGEVKWVLSGRTGGDFDLVGSNETTGFCYQHDIRQYNSSSSGVSLHMHDNHNSPIENNTVPATGKSVYVDLKNKEVYLNYRLLNESDPIYPTAQGSLQPLADGNYFVGHGWIPIQEEFSASGEILTTIQFGAAEALPGGGYVSQLAPTFSYRSFKQHWVGCPNSRPDVVAEAAMAGTSVWMSWNGATDVAEWAIYGGENATSLECVTVVPKEGFETEAHVGSFKYVQVKPKMKPGSSCSNVMASRVVAVSS